MRILENSERRAGMNVRARDFADSPGVFSQAALREVSDERYVGAFRGCYRNLRGKHFQVSFAFSGQVPHCFDRLPKQISSLCEPFPFKVGGADNGGQLARGLDVPGTDKLADYVHAVQKLPDNDHVRLVVRCGVAGRLPPGKRLVLFGVKWNGRTT